MKKPGVAFWATVVVFVVLVAYPLSCDPAAWIVTITGQPTWLVNVVSFIYVPLSMAEKIMPAWLKDIYLAYVFWWMELAGP